MSGNTDRELLDLIAGTVAVDKSISGETVEKEGSPKLTFKRDENGILWSYDVNTGKKVGRIFEHGDDSKIDKIEEV